MKLRPLIETLSVVTEKQRGIKSLQFPGDCDQRDLLKAAERDATIKHGGNHDTVLDPKTGQVVTQIPRHDPKPNTCRSIIKDLKAYLMLQKPGA